jgi:phosphate transport system ATP-binding protein
MSEPTAQPADTTLTASPVDTPGESSVNTSPSTTIPRLDPIDAGRITASEAPRAVITATDVSCYYGSFRAVNEVTMGIGLHEITALIGPSGCGKSTVLRALNRMNDLIPGTRVTGTIAYHGMDIYGRTSTRSRSAAASGWCSRSPTRSRSRSTTTSPTAPRSPA